ncbi:MAG: RecX family transcriptional regulator [Oscillospiraceae bacterium]|jgi:SOS response regulatory protein OraA/RecX|nr:RecX family transcriptional regulator [Oscillospiraceae bacterium]
MQVLSVSPAGRGLVRVTFDKLFSFSDPAPRFESLPRYLRECGDFEEKRDYIFLDAKAFSERAYKEGEISGADLSELIQVCDRYRAWEKALGHLERRDYSRSALIKKLLEKGEASLSAAENAADKLEQTGLLDDERLALRLWEGFTTEKRLSAREARRRLTLAGIPAEIAEAAIGKPESGGDLKNIKQLLSTKYSRLLTDKENIPKIKQALLRRGFAFGDINAVLRQTTGF